MSYSKGNDLIPFIEDTSQANQVVINQMDNPRARVTNVEIGRVLRANTAGFTIGCRVSQISEPSFGSLVKAQPVDQRETIYGVIYDMHIDDDPLIRRLVLTEEPRPSIIEDQRQNRLLPVEMSVLAVGYRQNDRINYGLPPRPPLNLDPVYLCQDLDEVGQFSQDIGYLRMILLGEKHNVPVDQLLAAHILQTFKLRGHDLAWIETVIQELTELMRYDYDLLMPVLETVSKSLPE